MDSEHGLLSPDGRHRWDSVEKRWVEVGAPPPGQTLEGWRPPFAGAGAGTDPGATSALPPARPSGPKPPPGWGESPSGWGGGGATTAWGRPQEPLGATSPPPPATPPPGPPPPALQPRPWDAVPPPAPSAQPRPWEPVPPAVPAPAPEPRPWEAGYRPAGSPSPIWGSPSSIPPSYATTAAPSPWARSTARTAADSPAVGGVVAALGGAGLVIGAFLAWISATYQGTTISQKGIDTPAGDGWFFVAVGITICAAGIATLVAPNLWLAGLTILGAIASAGLTIYEFADVHGHIADAQAALGEDVGSYGPGLYLLAGACVLVLAGGVAEAVRGQSR